MTDKLVITDIREGSRRRGTQINTYGETLDLLKDLSIRTGQSLAVLANRMIKYAYNHVVIDTEEAAE